MVTTGRKVSKDLADYHAVIAADIKDFTSNTDIDNRMLASRLPRVMEDAFIRSDLDYSCVRFPGQAGDGFVVGIDYHKLPHLIHPLLDHLQDILTEHDVEFRTRSRDLRMRLRVGINIGPLPNDDDPAQSDGIGKAMNNVHRLLDAALVRDALQHTDLDTTFVAAVISQRAYEDAILTGACALPASRLTPIPVHVKQFTGDAWLYVPEPSGRALHRAFTCDSESSGTPANPAAAPQRAPAPMLNSIDHVSGGQVIQGTVTGGAKFTAAGPDIASGNLTGLRRDSAPHMPSIRPGDDRISQ